MSSTISSGSVLPLSLMKVNVAVTVCPTWYGPGDRSGLTVMPSAGVGIGLGRGFGRGRFGGVGLVAAGGGATLVGAVGAATGGFCGGGFVCGGYATPVGGLTGRLGGLTAPPGLFQGNGIGGNQPFDGGDAAIATPGMVATVRVGWSIIWESVWSTVTL